VLTDKTQPAKVIAGEKSRNCARMPKTNLPEKVMKAVRHKAEGRKVLFCGNFCDVLAELFFAIARVTCGLLGFNYGKYGAVNVVKAEVGEPIPRRGIIALDGHLQPDL
jgi:hypothetical protein